MRKTYPAGREITDAKVAEPTIERRQFHSEWNYTSKPCAGRLERLRMQAASGNYSVWL